MHTVQLAQIFKQIKYMDASILKLVTMYTHLRLRNDMRTMRRHNRTAPNISMHLKHIIKKHVQTSTKYGSMHEHVTKYVSPSCHRRSARTRFLLEVTSHDSFPIR